MDKTQDSLNLKFTFLIITCMSGSTWSLKDRSCTKINDMHVSPCLRLCFSGETHTQAHRNYTKQFLAPLFILLYLKPEIPSPFLFGKSPYPQTLAQISSTSEVIHQIWPGLVHSFSCKHLFYLYLFTCLRLGLCSVELSRSILSYSSLYFHIVAICKLWIKCY